MKKVSTKKKPGAVRRRRLSMRCEHADEYKIIVAPTLSELAQRVNAARKTFEEPYEAQGFSADFYWTWEFNLLGGAKAINDAPANAPIVVYYQTVQMSARRWESKLRRTVRSTRRKTVKRKAAQ